MMSTEQASVRRITTEERRARLGRRHLLAAPAQGVVDAARGLDGLHSSDPVSVFLAARARTSGIRAEDVEAALYDDRSLARILGMRRTMFVVPVDLVPTIHAGCTRALAPRERKRFVKMVEDAGIAKDGASWLDAVATETMTALETRGEATAVELSEDVPGLRERIRYGEGKSWGGTFGVSTRVLFLLATEGRIVRGRPRGSWISSQYRWAPVDSWLGVDIEARDTDESRVELAGRWLATFGPATFEDLKWWTGWTVTQTRKALADLDVVEVDLGGQTGIVLADDVDPVEAPLPWAALLPGLDPTVMGWTKRDWYLPAEHRELLFDRNGNAGPTVWWNGRIIGGWAQRHDGEIAIRLLEDVGAEAKTAIEAEAAALVDWVGDVRFTPRFRTPLDRELDP